MGTTPSHTYYDDATYSGPIGPFQKPSRFAYQQAFRARYGFEPTDHALGRSRGGDGSKIHLVCDGHGLPMAVTVTAGQRHESTQFEAVLDQVRVPRRKGRPRRRPRRVAGDKGYSYPRIRRHL